MATEHSFSFNGETVDYLREEYQRNDSNGKYEKLSTGVPFRQLPAELWIEEVRNEITSRYSKNRVITGRTQDGKRVFYTSLRNTPMAGYLHANDYDKFEVCFQFWQSDIRLTVYYFHKIRVYPSAATSFYARFLAHLNTQQPDDNGLEPA